MYQKLIRIRLEQLLFSSKDQGGTIMQIKKKKQKKQNKKKTKKKKKKTPLISFGLESKTMRMAFLHWNVFLTKIGLVAI